MGECVFNITTVKLQLTEWALFLSQMLLYTKVMMGFEGFNKFRVNPSNRGFYGCTSLSTREDNR